MGLGLGRVDDEYFSSLLSFLFFVGGRFEVTARLVGSFGVFDEVGIIRLLVVVEAEFVNVPSLSDVVEADVGESRVVKSSKVDVATKQNQ